MHDTEVVVAKSAEEVRRLVLEALKPFHAGVFDHDLGDGQTSTDVIIELTKPGGPLEERVVIWSNDFANSIETAYVQKNADAPLIIEKGHLRLLIEWINSVPERE